MRSDLIFDALPHVSNRYQLCRLAATATRRLHKPRSRIQDTMNDALTRFSKSSPVHVPQVARLLKESKGREAMAETWLKCG